MNFKRLSVICGHYGSGKTNVAVNLAYELKKTCDNVVVADLDIVNPYFRTKDSADELKAAGIRLICSEYASTNIDIPAMTDSMYALTDDRTINAVLDIGGDDRGALALGRLAPQIVEENNYDCLAVVNCFRPLTKDAASTVEVLREIEYAGGINFTGIINNSNLGNETVAEDVLNSCKYADEIAKTMNIPVVLTTVNEPLYSELDGKIDNLFGLKLQPKIV